MDDEKYKGKTEAEWRAMLGGDTDHGENRTTIREAILYFDKRETGLRLDAEEQRFRAQFDQTLRQNWWTRWIAIAALIVSIASPVYFSHRQQSSSPGSGSSPPRSQPVSSAATNAIPTGRATMPP